MQMPAKVIDIKTKAEPESLPKLAFVSEPGLDNFIIPVATSFQDRGYEIKICSETNDKKLVDTILPSDIVWIEWANELAMHLTTDLAILNQKNVILRLHSYEAFQPWINYIDWERVDHLIFVADHIRQLVLERIPKIEQLVEKIHVIPNGVDTTKFSFRRRGPGKKLAYIGYINFKKGPMLLVQAFAKLATIVDGVELHIIGKFQEPRYELYFKHFLAETGLTNKVFFNGWVNNVPKWLIDKNYIVSTSVLESQGLGILEAMACGCKPLIHNWYGCANVYPKEYRWTTIDDFVDLFLTSSYDSESYRQFVENRYSLKTQMEWLTAIIDSCESKIPKFTNSGTLPENLEPVTISVCMMVKDEAKNLDRCLTSIKELADEIIVIDTGSKDNSVEICERYGAKVYHHPWRNFSEHRNQSLGYASMDWVVHIDADEEFVGDPLVFKKSIAALQHEVEAFTVFLDDMDENEASSVKNYPARVFKRGKVKYRYTVHNEPVFDKKKVAYSHDIKFLHYGYHGDEKLKKKKSKRTIHFLEKELVDNPDRTKVLFYLFQSYCDIGEIQRGLKYGEQYLLKRQEAPDFNASIFFSMITCYLNQKQYGRAYQLLQEALLIIPNDIDIAMAMIEVGVAIGNGNLLIDGIEKYKVAYKYLTKNPTAAGIRFTYSFRPDSLAYVIHRASMLYLENGVEYSKQLNKIIETLDEPVSLQIRKEFGSNLAIMGLTINNNMVKEKPDEHISKGKN